MRVFEEGKGGGTGGEDESGVLRRGESQAEQSTEW